MGVIHYMPATATANSAPSSAATPAAVTSDAKSDGPKLWSNGSFGFKDLLDIVNPLQHLPVIGSIYRYLTGDEPSGGARIIGDTIFGGPIGFGTGVVSAMLTDSKGHDLGERALAAVFGPSSSDGPTVGTPSIAGNDAPPPAQARTAQLQAPSAQAPLPAQAPRELSSFPSLASLNTPSSSPSPAQPVGLPATQPNMAGLYRSATAAPSAPTPEQTFLAQAAQAQRQAANGQTLNNRGIPLELTSNLLPSPRAAARPTNPVQPAPAAQTAGVQPTAAPGAAPAATGPVDPAAANPGSNPIAQKMMDALTKYQQLKKAEEKGDSTPEAAPPKVDLSL